MDKNNTGELSNAQVARKLREVAAAYTLKNVSVFQIRAYETAANIIEQSSEEIKDLWEDGRLDQIPGIGESLKEYLDELFKTGKVKHWEEVKKGLPNGLFELLDVPGIGPKTALKLVKLGIDDLKDLKHKIKTGELLKKGFSEKILTRIASGIEESVAVKSGRMLLPYAFAQAERILKYLKEDKSMVAANALGSLRRMLPTIGDLDFAVASSDPGKTLEYISLMPGISRVVDRGERDITIALPSGIHLDFIVVPPTSYGALLQHFTGSKKHNVYLRTLAENKGFSLSEYGVRKVQNSKSKVKSEEVIECRTEEGLYKLLGMQTPPPEIREDIGEIELALKHQLPKLLELEEMKGDLHIHSNFPIEPSHDLGTSSLEELVKFAQGLGYTYIGVADHSPSISKHNKQDIVQLIKRRTERIAQVNSSQKQVRVLNLLEVDILPNGELAVPDEGLRLLDFALAGVHSVHRMPKDQMTKRILRALENPYVKVLTHPTGRLLNERNSYEADWKEIFKFAAKNKNAMEINAFSNRLDLTDTLIREAKSFGVKFTIDTDSHQASQMVNIRFGVAMARRGWLEKDDVVNSWDYQKILEWFKIRR